MNYVLHLLGNETKDRFLSFLKRSKIRYKLIDTSYLYEINDIVYDIAIRISNALNRNFDYDYYTRDVALKDTLEDIYEIEL